MYDYIDIDSTLKEKLIPYRNIPQEIRYQFIAKKNNEFEKLSGRKLMLNEICERVFLSDKDID